MKRKLNIKKQGYILFYYIDVPNYKNKIICDMSCNEEGIIYKTPNGIMRIYNIHLEDKWDYKNRHCYHYFYLNLSTMEFNSLPKWKYGYQTRMGYADERVSKKMRDRYNAKEFSEIPK